MSFLDRGNGCTPHEVHRHALCQYFLGEKITKKRLLEALHRPSGMYNGVWECNSIRNTNQPSKTSKTPPTPIKTQNLPYWGRNPPSIHTKIKEIHADTRRTDSLPSTINSKRTAPMHPIPHPSPPSPIIPVLSPC